MVESVIQSGDSSAATEPVALEAAETAAAPLPELAPLDVDLPEPVAFGVAETVETPLSTTQCRPCSRTQAATQTRQRTSTTRRRRHRGSRAVVGWQQLHHAPKLAYARFRTSARYVACSTAATTSPTCCVGTSSCCNRHLHASC